MEQNVTEKQKDKIKESSFLTSHKNSILVSFLTSIITLTIAITVYSFNLNAKQYMISPLSHNISTVSTSQNNLSPAVPLSDTKTLGILLLGQGGMGHSGGYLTDAMQLLYINFEKGTISLISIPRDIWITLPNGRGSKINFAFQQSSDFAKKVVSEITGLPVNYYASIDFVGFMRTIGIELKGIDVNVSQRLDDPWYPINGEELNSRGYTTEEVAQISVKYSGFELERQFPCRYEDLHFEKGLVHMEGGDALKYVRSRHGSSEGDVSRGKRQQEVLIGIKNKIFSLETIDNIPTLYEALVQHVQTDISLEISQYFSPLINNSKEFNLVTVNLGPGNVLAASTSTGGAAIFIPKEGTGKWETTQKFIIDQIDND